jgi:hypothetical protein
VWCMQEQGLVVLWLLPLPIQIRTSINPQLGKKYATLPTVGFRFLALIICENCFRHSISHL